MGYHKIGNEIYNTSKVDRVKLLAILEKQKISIQERIDELKGL